jgi:hypothetical protein
LEAGRDYMSVAGSNDLRVRGVPGHVTWLPWPLSQGKGLGMSPVYTYVNSQVPDPWGKKFLFFLTYCNYNGALKACQGGVSVPSFPCV